MPLRFKRHWTPYGEIIHRRGPRGSNLLVTRRGKNLLLNFRKLLSSVKVKPMGAKDRVIFAPELHPKLIGEGAHGMLFVLSPKEEASFRRRGRASKGVHRPSVVLKVYRESTPREVEPDGFTQFYANDAVYKYLKMLPAKSFVVRPLQYYFVSDKLTVRNFINAPTIEELQESFTNRRVRRKPLSLALKDKEIDHFVQRFDIALREVNELETKLELDLERGQKLNFNAKVPVTSDPTIKNFFVLGRNTAGQFIVSTIDQGRLPIRGLVDKIRKGIIH